MALRYKRDKAPKGRADAGGKMVQWVRAAIGNDENVGISVNISACGHAACAGGRLSFFSCGR